jgi:uncharacterized RDD family membrane protein YckC
MDGRYTVDTPENIEFSYDIAGIGSRFLAAIVDTLIILVAQAIIFLVLALAISSLDLGQSLITAAAALISFIVLWGYYIAFELAWNGQSPGKRLLKLRVVREGGRPITPLASAIRNLIRLVDFLPAFYGIGVVTIFIDRRSRRLGDLAAGVQVVRERSAITLESLTARSAATAPLIAPPAADIEQVASLDEQGYALVQEFLRRRSELGGEARVRIATQLAQGLERKIGPGGGVSAEGFIERIDAAYRARRSLQEAVSTTDHRPPTTAGPQSHGAAEPGDENQELRTQNQEPATEQNPDLKVVGSSTTDHQPRTTAEPGAESQEPGARNQEPATEQNPELKTAEPQSERTAEPENKEPVP